MLVLTRRIGEEIWIDKGQIQIKFLCKYNGEIALGINAPLNVDIERKEIFFKKRIDAAKEHYKKKRASTHYNNKNNKV